MKDEIKTSRKITVYISLFFLAVYWSLLLYLTSMPVPQDQPFFIWDKLIHFTAYAGLAFLYYIFIRQQYWFSKAAKKPLVYTLIVVLLYGVADELHQIFIPGRSCELGDLIANYLGVVFGLAIAFLGIKLILRFYPEQNSAKEV